MTKNYLDALRWRQRFAHCYSAHQKYSRSALSTCIFIPFSLSVFLFIFVRFGFNVNLHNLLSVTQSMYVINYQLIAIQWSFCSTTCDDVCTRTHCERRSKFALSFSRFPIGGSIHGQTKVSIKIRFSEMCSRKMRACRINFYFFQKFEEICLNQHISTRYLTCS